MNGNPHPSPWSSFGVSQTMTAKHVRFLLLLLFSLPMAACAGSIAEPEVDPLLEMAAATLTAFPSRTPPPSATIPVTPKATGTPTTLPTVTSTQGPSPTPSAPPLSTSDPRFGLNLSQPNVVDSFNVPFTWGEYRNDSASNLILKEQLQAIDNLTDSRIWWTTTKHMGSNVYVEVSAEIRDCAGRDFAGLGLRIGEFVSSGYTFEISCDGYYRIRKFSTASVEVLRDWAFTRAINTGSGTTNQIGFTARGNLLTGVVNDILLGSVEDHTYFSGTFALYAGAEQTPGLSVHFDDFKIWYFSP